MSLTSAGVEPQPSLAWQFENSNVDSVTSLAPSSQVSPGPAQLQGSAALVTNAPTSNTAVSFPSTGGAYMNLGTGSPINFNINTSNLFVEAWIYFVTFPPAYSLLMSVGTGLSDNYGKWFIAMDASNNIRFTTRDANNATEYNAISSTTLSTSRWYHIAASLDIVGKNMMVFTDGTLTGTFSVAGKTFANPTTTALIGATFNLSVSNIGAYIRDLRVVQGGVVPTGTFVPSAAPFSYALPSYVTGSGSVVFTLLGQFITYVPGKYNQAIKFTQPDSTGATAQQYINWNNTINLFPFTICLWFNFSSTNSATNDVLINMQTNSAVGNGVILITAGANSTAFGISGSGPASGIGGPSLTAGTWNHIAYTINTNGTSGLYINGSLYASGTVTSPASITSLYLASRVGIWGFNGLVDDLRIYNTALTSTQVASVYSSQGAPAPSLAMPLPKLAWDFESSNVDYVSSLSPTTMVGTPTYTNGKYGQAIQFTNTPPTSSQALYYTIPSSVGSMVNGLTVSFWLNPQSLPNAQNQTYVYIDGPMVGSTGAFWMFMNNGTSTTALLYGQNPSAGGYFPGVNGPTVPQGSWTHMTGVWTPYNGFSNVMTLYVNGVFAQSIYYANAFTINRLTLATNAGGRGSPCIIDDLRIFDQSLTSLQVQSIYNQQGVPGRGALVPQYIKSATGGNTIQDIGGYRIHTFTTVGTSTFTPATSGNVEVLVVAGGGSGGIRHAGGGGAGGLIYNSSFSVSGAVNVTVGDGGAARLGTSGSGAGTQGGNSGFSSLTAIGGGFGNSGNGGSGGSGGGTWNLNAVGTGTAGQGNDGAFGSVGPFTGENSYGGGGGGGAGAKGTASTSVSPVTAGSGGIGLQYSISGAATYYAGGGGGSTTIAPGSGATGGAGGLGGGGAGGGLTNGFADGIAGTNGTGGGGGAGGFSNATGNYNSGKGGSGIVIVRYPIQVALTGTPLFSQLSQAATSSAVGAFSLRAVNGVSVKAVNVRPVAAFPPAAMTGATTSLNGYIFGGSGSYVSSASSTVGAFSPWRAFDKLNINDANEWAGVSGNYPSSTTYAGSNATTVSSISYPGEWLQIQFPSLFLPSSITITSPWNAGSARTFVFAGSIDGTNWVLLINQTSATILNTNNTSQSFPITTNSTYKYFRLILSTAYTTYGQVGELVIFGSTDGSATDFYADRLGNLLTAPVVGQSLANWLGGATGYVTTWYDQSGKGNHASQATAANQPVIQRATKGPGYMCLYSGTQGLNFGAYDLLNNKNYTTCGVVRRTAVPTGTNYYLCGDGGVNGTDQKFHSGYRNSTQLTLAHYSDDTNLTVPSFLTSSTEPTAYNYLMLGTGLSGRLYSYSAGTLYSGTRTYLGYLNQSTGASFSIGGGFGTFIGEIYELLVFTQSLYDLDNTGGLVTQIYNNQLSAYGT